MSDAEGKPITTREVCVEADLQSSNESYGYGSATIGAGGEYSITGLPAGSYKVYFYDCGSTRNDLPQYYDGAGTANAASLVVLSAGGAQAGINATMQPATTISGHVYGTSDTSTPLQGICVEALPTNGESELYGQVDTSADGSYTIDHITPSTEYRVYFRDCNDPEHYLSQYYDGASYSSATILTPTVASPATGIDAHMEKGASISGTVSDAEGKPITTRDICVTVYAASYDDYSENDYGSAATDSSGNYTVGGLAPGSYDVEFADCDYDGTRNDRPQYYDDQANGGSAEPVTLTAEEEETGIDASLQPATSISGHVYAGSGDSTPLAGICVDAYVASEDGAYDYVSYTYTAADGSYTLLHLAPSTGYKVEFSDCDDLTAYESQFYEDASEYSLAKTVTPSASPTTGIDAHLVKDPLQVTITGGPANGASSNATDANFAFTSEVAKATFECELDGKGFMPCGSPVLASTLNGGAALANGTHTFSVEAVAEGKTGPVKTIYWTIDTSGPTSTSGGSTPAGGTFSSAPGQSPSTSTPVITEVTVPVAAEIALTNEPATTPSANGYTVFGQQIRIAATDGSGNPITGTAADPIALTFSLDATEVPAGVNLAEITVLRNGSPAGNCTKDGTAEPDPCVSSRTALPGGGVQITVLTTHCSLWNFALTSPGSKSGSGEQTGPPSKETSPGGGGNPGAPGNNPPGSSPSPSGAGAPAGPTAAGGVLGITIGRAATPTKPLSRAQKLAKAITACRKVKKSKRQQCVAAAKRRYAPSKPKTRKKRKD
ncbi:MAG TPA: carboxypeptidase-like regulatory domain-containing protein [Solirubrobacteraceae bacterium]|nr:carboxypeptidase-like regulatory domain-containing protein [Solirubrobacteraceae bacterium]